MITRPAALAVFALSAAAVSSTVIAQPAPTRFALTVYSSADPAGFDPRQFDDNGQTVPGYGVVRETRPIDLKAGLNTLRFADVASGIDATTVGFESLTDPANTSVLEQNYEFDLVSQQALLQKYIDKTVFVDAQVGDNKTETVEGTLLSADGGLVLKTAAGVRMINGYTGVRVDDAAGLITKPTLVWQIAAKQEGKHDALVTYQTAGLTWRADYNIVLDEANTAADVGAWVTLLNKSGASYPDTRLKLVAGDVQRVSPPQAAPRPRMAKAMLADTTIGSAGFEEKAFFEYHQYTLGRTTSLPNNSTKQIELFEKKLAVPAAKQFVYYGLAEQFRTFTSSEPAVDRDLGTQMNKKVDVYLTIDNKEAAGLGIPLPAGRVRVYQRDEADKTQEFVGEDVIGHTPKDETLRIKLGSAFDVVGERVQTDFKIDDKNHHWATESFKITLRNHKKQAVKVIVKENLYRWTNWEITDNSDPFAKQDFRTAHFPIDVPAGGEKTVTYTVKYTW